MKYIIQKFENKFYTYKPGEFLPIYEGGVLLNKKDFVIYKVRSMVLK